MNYKEILKQLCDNEAIQNLLVAANQVKSDDPDTMIFKDDNSKLSLKVTDNGIAFHYSSETPSYRNEFTKFCDTLDDEFFERVCDLYTTVKGEGALNELNKNLTKENTKEFYSYVKQAAEDRMKELLDYRKAAVALM